ncbi:class I SAM-dependent methyltransferase, partial [Streptococcus pneumoniae]
MSQQVNGFDLILEIGAGDGRATCLLAKQGHSIVSVEENPYCLDKTEQRLKAEGIQGTRINRGKLEYEEHL